MASERRMMASERKEVTWDDDTGTCAGAAWIDSRGDLCISWNGMFTGSIPACVVPQLTVLLNRPKPAVVVNVTDYILTALRSARQTIISAVQVGCDLPDFDPAEHVTVKEIDAAIRKATEGT